MITCEVDIFFERRCFVDVAERNYIGFGRYGITEL